MKCGWKCHIQTTELQKSGMFFTDTVFNVTNFCTNCVHSVPYFASQIKEMRSEILVTDIIV